MTTDDVTRKLARWALLARIRLALWIMGDNMGGIFTLYQLITERAKRAITPDGRVILAECKPLADALYTQVPGRWTLTIARSGAAEPEEVPHGE